MAQIDRPKAARTVLLWKALLFLVLATVIYPAEQYVLQVPHPSETAELAVKQLQSSDEAAEALRRHEWRKDAGLLLVAGGISVIGILLFAGDLWRLCDRIRLRKRRPQVSEMPRGPDPGRSSAPQLGPEEAGAAD